MANAKRVNIRGLLPFDLGIDANPEHGGLLRNMLAFTLYPTSGLALDWDRHPDRMVASPHGGQTAIYGFHLSGVEALSFGWFDELKRHVAAVGGAVLVAEVEDIQA